MFESLYYAAHKFKSIYLLTSVAKLSHNVTTSGKPVDTQSKINVRKTFILHPGRVLNVFCAFSKRMFYTCIYWKLGNDE